MNVRPEDLAYMDLIDLKELERQAYIEGQRLLGAAVNRIIEEIEAAEEDRQSVEALNMEYASLQVTYDDLCNRVEGLLELFDVMEAPDGELVYYLFDDGWKLADLFEERGMDMPQLEVTNE